jgi:glycyl-tRNA synthetase beta chain
MKKPLLIEIGVEELPAVPFLKELPFIHNKWQEILKKYSLLCEFEFFYTPRRLVLWHKEALLKQEDSIVEMFGAPIEIAYKDGKPTPAALGFAKKCGVDISEISKTEKNGKEILYFKKEQKGSDAKELLDDMLEEFLKSLNFGKSMRWGDRSEQFIRPIRWITVMYDKDVIDLELYGVKSQNLSYPHRSISYEPFAHDGSEDYFSKLDKAGVILYPNERKKIILEQFREIESKHSCKIEVDGELLDEIVAITENPKALFGEFDESFLKLPSEVIITSMKEHQRYFPVFKDNKLSNHFIVVSNSICDDFSEVVKGNEKVLRARLSDGLFFFENDLKNGLSTDALKNITFMQGGGTVYDKSKREAQIAKYLQKRYDIKDGELLQKTVLLAKADLLTDMVYEFTELQGLMGYYYAKAANEDDRLCIALKEQYLPDGEDSKLPSSDFSAVVALSLKLDSLLKLFEMGNIPTGTKDPFALRRAVIGVIKIVLDRNFEFDIDKDLKNLSKNYENLDHKKLESFFIDRINQYFKVNPSLIQAVLQSGERDIVRIDKKIKALDSIVSKSDFKSLSSTFKRVANIIKDMDLEKKSIDSSLFSEDAEKSLYKSYKSVIERDYDSYEDRLEALFLLKDDIDNFFDKVMVNVDDESIKANRKNLIQSIYLSFREIADIKEISV